MWRTKGCFLVAIDVTLDQIHRLASNAQPAYVEAFRIGQPVLDHFGISATPLRVAHFMAQILHESAGLQVLQENLHYTAARMVRAWPAVFAPRGPADPHSCACDPEKLADVVYGGKNGNGDAASGDGYRYRGRGLLQLTGKGNYQQATALLRRQYPTAPDLCSAPDDVCSPQWSLAIAGCYWLTTGCNELAAHDDLRGVTEKINGHRELGLPRREEWLEKAKSVWR
jgi:putative chitinase